MQGLSPVDPWQRTMRVRCKRGICRRREASKQVEKKQEMRDERALL